MAFLWLFLWLACAALTIAVFSSITRHTSHSLAQTLQKTQRAFHKLSRKQQMWIVIIALCGIYLLCCSSPHGKRTVRRWLPCRTKRKRRKSFPKRILQEKPSCSCVLARLTLLPRRFKARIQDNVISRIKSAILMPWQWPPLTVQQHQRKGLTKRDATGPSNPPRPRLLVEFATVSLVFDRHHAP